MSNGGTDTVLGGPQMNVLYCKEILSNLRPYNQIKVLRLGLVANQRSRRNLKIKAYLITKATRNKLASMSQNYNIYYISDTLILASNSHIFDVKTPLIFRGM